MTKKAPEQWQNRIVGYGEESPEQLLANPLNFRIHSKHQQDALLGALEEVGVVQDVIINKDSGFLVDGHLRVTLAMRTGQATIPVKYVSLSEHEERLILATFDPISALATTDAQKLDELLHEVSTGSAAIQQMLDDMAESAGLYLDKPTGAGGDEFDTTPQEGPTTTQLGDLWQLGEHRLLVGDCTIAENVDRLLASDRADALVADPPYGMSLDTDFRGMGSVRAISKRYAAVTGDDAPFDPSPFLTAFADTREQFWWGADYYARRLPEGGSWIVWDKRTGIEGMSWSTSEFELCWSKTRHHRKVLRHRWAGVHGMEQQDTKARIHPNQKPIGLIAEMLDEWTGVGALVFDPFLGSGTTLIACERLGRKCYGCEIEPKYGDVILRRWEAETGQEVVLLDRLTNSPTLAGQSDYA